MVWGAGKPLSTVGVTVQGQKVSSACDQDGKWKVTLKPLKTSFSETMIIRSGEETPFIVMQLPPFGTWMNNNGNNYVSIRASQQKVSDDTSDGL